MRILFVSDNIFNPILGGTERVTDILAGMLSKNHSVFYLCEPNGDPIILNYNYPAHVFFLPEDGGYSNSKNQKYYLEIVKKNNIDVVVNQRGWAPYFNCMIGREVPVISVVHSVPDSFVRYNMNNLFRHNKTTISLLKYCCKILLYPLYTAVKRFSFRSELKKHFQYLFNHSSAVIFLSEEYVHASKKLIAPREPKCLVGHIPNPTPLPVVFDMNRKEKIVLYVGRLTKVDKRPERLLRIWSKIYKKHPEWKMVFVGDGEYRTELEDCVFKKSLENVHFAGATQDVGSYYAKSSIICLTSDFEGWPMCLVEGMSYGCVPVVFNSFSSAAEIVTDNSEGYLIRPFDINDFTRKLEDIMSDDFLRAMMSKAAISKASMYSPEMILQKWEALFNLVTV